MPNNETLAQKQQRFTRMIGDFLGKLSSLGYEATLGEAYRPPEQAALNAAKGIGIRNSLHTLRLAVDLNLFRNGNYLSRTEDCLEAGKLWESMGGSWGGRFVSRPDGNHFSLEHNGVR